MRLGDSIEVPFTVLLALVLLLLAAHFRRVSLSGRTEYNRMFEQVNPSLTASPSPADRMWNGFTGCATWIVNWFLMVIAFGIGIDLLFTGGENTARAYDALPEIAAGTVDVLVRIARLLLDVLRMIAETGS